MYKYTVQFIRRATDDEQRASKMAYVASDNSYDILNEAPLNTGDIITLRVRWNNLVANRPGNTFVNQWVYWEIFRVIHSPASDGKAHESTTLMVLPVANPWADIRQ